MAGKINHLEEALKSHERALHGGSLELVHSHQASALLHASLEIAEQLRIANILALRDANVSEAAALAANRAAQDDPEIVTRLAAEIKDALDL